MKEIEAMLYLEDYGVTEKEIDELKELYNDSIINFLTEEEIFIKDKIDYLIENGYMVYPILKNNIKIFLETLPALEKKINQMKEKGYSRKAIQMILIDQKLYDDI